MIQPAGTTEIGLAMQHALSVLKSRRSRNEVSSIFFLSDGLNNEAYKEVPPLIEQINVEGNYTINTFGFGNDHDPDLMTHIAGLGDGNFYFIEKYDQIDEAFVDCLGGLMTTIA